MATATVYYRHKVSLGREITRCPLGYGIVINLSLKKRDEYISLSLYMHQTVSLSPGKEKKKVCGWIVLLLEVKAEQKLARHQLRLFDGFAFTILYCTVHYMQVESNTYYSFSATACRRVLVRI